MSGVTKQAATPTTIARDVDWTKCPAVHRVPGRLGGAWIVKGTRIPVSAILQNYNAGYSAEQLSTEVFEGLPLKLASEIIEYATQGR